MKTSGASWAVEVEVDETFIGGKARNMHLDVKKRRITGTGGHDKTVVIGALERGGKVRTQVVADRKRALSKLSQRACRSWRCSLHRCAGVL